MSSLKRWSFRGAPWSEVNEAGSEAVDYYAKFFLFEFGHIWVMAITDLELIGSTLCEMRRKPVPKEEASAPGVQSQYFGSEFKHMKKKIILGKLLTNCFQKMSKTFIIIFNCKPI